MELFSHALMGGKPPLPGSYVLYVIFKTDHLLGIFCSDAKIIFVFPLISPKNEQLI